MVAAFWPMLGLVLVALTTLAYKKPREYERLAPILMLLVGTLAMGGMIYNAGYTNGSMDAQRFMTTKGPDVYFKEKPFPFDGFKAFVLAVVIVGYLSFLFSLPSILRAAGKSSGETGKDET